MADIQTRCRQPLKATLRGITNDGVDPSVDVWRTVTLPMLRKILGDDAVFELKVVSRGAPPGEALALGLALQGSLEFLKATCGF